MMNKELSFNKWELGLLLLCFFSCLMGAMLISMHQCPDEAGRGLLSQWMVRYHSLPSGNEMETMLGGWGFSYALRPFLSSIVGALFQSFFSLFTSNPTVLLTASRMCSVLSVTLCCWFCLRLGHRCFSGLYSSFLFAAFVCFLPQVQFLGMYQNNDALSLCAVSAVWYYLAEGFDTHWRVKSCIWLAVWLSVGALSYYVVYPWFLMGIVFFVFAVVHDREISEKSGFILRRGGLVVGICLVLAGWFFVRNAMLHQGDFLGMVEELRSRARLLEQGYRLFEYHSAKAEGIPFLAFLEKGEDFDLPSYKELPSVELYMEQVLKYVNTLLADLNKDEGKPLTSFMVNNYVKAKMISEPVKKKYSKDQIGYLIAISMMKSAISMADIAVLLEFENRVSTDKDKLYTFWSDLEESILSSKSEEVAQKVAKIKALYDKDHPKNPDRADAVALDQLAYVALRLSIEAQANKVLSTAIISSLRDVLHGETAKTEAIPSKSEIKQSDIASEKEAERVAKNTKRARKEAKKKKPTSKKVDK